MRLVSNFITHAKVSPPHSPFERLNGMDFKTVPVSELEAFAEILSARIKKIEHDFLRSSVHELSAVAFQRGLARSLIDLTKELNLTIELKRSRDS